jgi:hypothetical protein
VLGKHSCAKRNWAKPSLIYMVIAHEVGDNLGHLGRNLSDGLGWVGWGEGVGGRVGVGTLDLVLLVLLVLSLLLLSLKKSYI